MWTTEDSGAHGNLHQRSPGKCEPSVRSHAQEERWEDPRQKDGARPPTETWSRIVFTDTHDPVSLERRLCVEADGEGAEDGEQECAVPWTSSAQLPSWAPAGVTNCLVAQVSPCHTTGSLWSRQRLSPSGKGQNRSIFPAALCPVHPRVWTWFRNAKSRLGLTQSWLLKPKRKFFVRVSMCVWDSPNPFLCNEILYSFYHSVFQHWTS